jgi:hypothetical protein
MALIIIFGEKSQVYHPQKLTAEITVCYSSLARLAYSVVNEGTELLAAANPPVSFMYSERI